MMNLLNAQDIAWKIRQALEPFCDKIEIAGSTRRERPVVNDIDLVLIPKQGGALREIIARCGRTCTQVVGKKPDPRNLIFMMKGDVQLDLYVAHSGIPDLVAPTPTNWGAVLLCRTGSMIHNIQLCSVARGKGSKFAPYRGVVAVGKCCEHADGEIIASETEADIYRALGLDYREPTNRETLS
jgi:DNA polymerase (family 10)